MITLASRALTVPTIITRVFKLPTEKASLIVTTVYSRYDVVDIVGNHYHSGAENLPKNVLFRICIDIHGETK